VVTATNSIHGTYLLDTVNRATALANGDYVVSSPLLDVNGKQDVGGAIWASGTEPTATGLDSTNSIIGSTPGDHVGWNVTALTAGNYVVQSDWQTPGLAKAGASTWATGLERTAMSVNDTNSLVNSQAGDGDGARIVPLTNGNYLVAAPFWANGGLTRVGAVTWGSGIAGVAGTVDPSNSFVGSGTDDWVGITAVALPNGNALIATPLWNFGMGSDAGMIRIISGTGSTAGPVTVTNSLYGTHTLDRVGGYTLLADGNVLAHAQSWDNGATTDVGAATWISATGGPTGEISASNSIIGSAAGDAVGGGVPVALSDGAVVFQSSGVDNGANLNAGAATYVEPGGEVGTLSAANSVFGELANQGGQMQIGARYTKADGVVVGRPTDNKVTVIVTRDKTPPSFAPVANVVVPAAPGAHSAVVDYPLPIASDARSTPTVACTPPPGSTFPVGLTTVTCVATDGVGLTTTATFTVTVTSTDDYVPLPPARIADTRRGFTTIDGLDAGAGLLDVGSTLELQVAGRGGVAPDASAATLNVTAVDAVAPGFATVWPCGEPRPTASNLNFATGATVPNAVIAKIGAAGKVCLFTSQPIHFVVDVNGYAPATTSYRPLNPGRLLDTRGSGTTVDGSQQGAGLAGANSTTTLQVRGRGGVPTDATSVVLNVTTTESAADGYITAYPCDSDRPNASSVNGVARATVANLVIAKLSADGTVCLFSQSATHLIADVNGYFVPGGSYVPLVPARLQDSRPGFSTVDGKNAGAGLIPLGTVTPLHINGRGGVPDASTVVLNVTVTEPGAAGYVTVYPCGIDPPNASNLNYATNQTVANGALVKVGTGGDVCLYNSQATHLVVDVTGYFPT